MSSTTRRRAAGIGVGALAAVVLAAPSALAQTDPLLLEPAEGSVVASISTYPVTEEVDGGDAVASVPDSGLVSVALGSGLSAVAADLSAGLLDVDEYEEYVYGATDVLPDPFLEGLEVTVDDGGRPAVVVTVPVDDAALDDVDEVFLLVEGVEVDLLGTSSPLVVALDLVPAGDDVALVDASVDLSGALPEPLTLEAGGSFTVSLPEEDGLLRAVGADDLDELFVYLNPVLDEDDELETEPQRDVVVRQGRATAGLAPLADDEDVDDGPVIAGSPEVEVDGTSATVTVAEDQEPGTYEAVFLTFGEDLTTVALVAEAEVAVAVEPEPGPGPGPTPVPTVTAAPVPTPTATTPPRRNPGLRSNTGVETAAVPGLSDGQLAGLGGGLLALGTVAGVAVVRTQRRSRA